jgi:hypothetical protein
VLAGSLTILGSLALGSTAATAASKPRKTAMVSCSSDRLVRPTRYTLGCGTGTYVLTAITWTSWGLRTAGGRAVYTFNTCTPTCAASSNVSYKASITASNVQKTKKGYVYRKILLVYKKHGRPTPVQWTMPSH